MINNSHAKIIAEVNVNIMKFSAMKLSIIHSYMVCLVMNKYILNIHYTKYTLMDIGRHMKVYKCNKYLDNL